MLGKDKENEMSDEWTKGPRVFYVRQEDFSNRALIRELGEKWPDDVKGEPSSAWVHVIEKSAYDKLERAWEVESEAHTFYKREWEAACERYDSLKADYDELKSGAAKLVEALKRIAASPDVYPTQGLYRTRDLARQVLAEYEGKK